MIRVTIVDDSPFVRRAFARILTGEGDLEVAGVAADGNEALEICRRTRPDVVLLDLAMPVLDGQTTLERLLRESPALPVIVVSAAAQRGASATLAALEAGAFDFVDKSSVPSMQLHDLRVELLGKVRAAAGRAHPAEAPWRAPEIMRPTPAIVVLGASTGGPQAITSVVEQMPADFPAPLAVVQHIPASFVEALVERVAARCDLPVSVARSGERLEPGRVYFAPGGVEVVVARASGAATLLSCRPEPGTPHVPSVDSLFHSAARAFGPRAWGVLLTGMGRDGAAGMAAIRRSGGLTVAQDEATSAVFGMPRAALEAGGAGQVLPLHAIPRYLIEATGSVMEVVSSRRP